MIAIFIPVVITIMLTGNLADIGCQENREQLNE